VCIDYVHGLCRFDSVVLGSDGKPAVRPGAPAAALQRPPRLRAGDILIAHVWVRGRSARLSPHDIFPVLETAYPEPPKATPSEAERLLPKSLGKLRRGETLRVLAWGDSVTDGTYLKDLNGRWQCRFADRLGKRIPGARIEVIHLGWGGRSTDSFLAEPPGSPWNYREKVLGAKADLVVSEFVNDAWMGPKEVEERYGRILGDLRATGAEWIIIAPHYVRPDWMGLDREREIDDDPRGYVKGLREFAARHGVALADASLRWGRLWRRGIPYTTLLGNVINHPDERGMELFADALLAIFP
jgi:lysophospholipase L1-like esterase